MVYIDLRGFVESGRLRCRSFTVAVRKGLLVLVAAMAAFGQAFEAASVKPGKPGTQFPYLTANGRYVASGTLFGHIEFAWDLMPSREQAEAMLAHAPKWVSTDQFEIEAKAEGNPAKDQLRLMVRSLLADRFQLQVHTVTKEAAVVTLTPEKPGTTGPKLRPHSEGQPCDVHLASPEHTVGVFPPVCEELMAVDTANRGILVAGRDMTIKQIAASLSALGILTRQAVDQTGFSGKFDFTIEFTRERKGLPPPGAQADDFQGTTLEEAMREQLGLKLKAANAPVDTLVIDRAERPSEN